jgi:hypothetical protein
MKRILSLPAFAAVLAIGAAAAPMQFSLTGIDHHISASGDITAGTPAAFERFMDSIRGNWQPVVALNSTGGNLLAALELGEAIRKHGLNTYVGGIYRNAQRDVQNLMEYGECDSACVWVFAGGVRRTLDSEAGTIGVHQFAPAKPEAGDGAVAQYLMVVVGRYLDEMGVNRGVLDVAALTAPETIQPVPFAAAARLRLATDGLR